MIDKLNEIFSGIKIIIIFGVLFQLLNGIDKFYNGTNKPNLAFTKEVIIAPDSNSEIPYKLHPMESLGLFGVNRDAKIIGYFIGG